MRVTSCFNEILIIYLTLSLLCKIRICIDRRTYLDDAHLCNSIMFCEQVQIKFLTFRSEILHDIFIIKCFIEKIIK